MTPSGYEVVTSVVSHLRAQDGRERLEIVVVCRRRQELGVVDSELEGFWGHKVVEAGDFRTTGQAMAAGFRAAGAPVVGYVEEHSFPEPGWADALIEAHRGPWSAVGVSVLNANPDTAVSWATLFLDFAPCVELGSSKETPAPPSHHTFYKRDVLRPYENELESMLEVEAVFQAALRRSGHRLYVEARARQRHVNISLVRSLLKGQYLGGRQYAPLRVAEEGFSTARRLLYAGAAPLIVVVQLRRVLREVARTGKTRELFPRLLALLLVGLAAEQVGETLGYLRPERKDAPERRMEIELDRSRHIREPGYDTTPEAAGRAT